MLFPTTHFFLLLPTFSPLIPPPPPPPPRSPSPRIDNHAPQSPCLEGPEVAWPDQGLYHDQSRSRHRASEEDAFDVEESDHHRRLVSLPPLPYPTLPGPHVPGPSGGEGVGIMPSFCRGHADRQCYRSQIRDAPSPSFNTADKDRSHVQPLVNPRGPEMDESYVFFPIFAGRTTLLCGADMLAPGSSERRAVRSSTR